MKKALFRALNIEAGEEARVTLLLAQSFFLGIFAATFETGANTLFLQAYGEAMLSKAFLVSGAAGIILTTIYSRLQSKISFSKLAIINLVAVTLLTCAMRLGFEVSNSRWIIFIVFMMAGPLNVMAMLGFWGMTGRMFTLRQGKRIFGMIDSGMVLGMIIISFATPLILAVMPEIKNLLLVSAISIIAALAIQFKISNTYGTNILQNENKNTANTAGIKELFKNRFILMMAVFVMLSMLGAFFVNYSYLLAVKEKYPSETDLAKFFGFFTAVVMIFSLLFKTVVYSKLMQTYGLKVSLLILPCLLIFFTAIAALFGTFMGYKAETSGFMLFFLFVALSKLFSQSLRGSIEIPAFKTLYQPLGKNIRYDVQAKIDGIVNEFSAFFSGVVLLALGSLVFINLIHFSYVLILILSGWTYVTFKLYTEYKSTLKKSLSDLKLTSNTASITQHEIREVLKKNIEAAAVPSDKVIYALKLAENIEPVMHEKSLIRSVKNSDIHTKQYALHKIKQNKLFDANDVVKQSANSENSPVIKKLAQEVFDYLNESQEQFITVEQITTLARSRNTSSREYAAMIIGKLKNKELTALHIDLIKDIDIKVKMAAISAAAKVNQPELLPYLIDGLSSPIFGNAATSAIIELGNSSLDRLDQAFYKSGLDTRTLLRIIGIYGIVKGDKATNCLLTKINYPDTSVAMKALLALRSCNYQASGNHINRIQQAVELAIGNASWNLAAIKEIEESEAIGPYLKEALNDEVKDSFERLYLLLSLLYDPQSISSIRENIDSGTSEGIGFAIELLDLFVAEELKPKLFPLLEDTPIAEKTEKLQVHFPRENFDSLEILKQIINRDYNQINKWTKACAIYAYREMKNAEVSDDLIANLFNPDSLLRETSAWVIYSLDRKIYAICSNRIAPGFKKETEVKLEQASKDKSSLLIEQIFFLKQVKQFSNVPGIVLAEMGKSLQPLYLDENHVLLRKQNDKQEQTLYVLAEGKAQVKNSSGTLFELEKNQLIGEMLLLHSDDDSTEIVATKGSLLYQLPYDKSIELIYNHSEFAEAVLNNIDSRMQEAVTK